ncbi:MAG: hypothetical protein A2017_06430 [Lentisphaerae bacterium GWF2_44_16]|nr:MAG: hypothetical protein A2017_06430 [Lentisphaerae bacterium GWF2_44_16]
MLALSIKQPWAWMIVSGVGRIPKDVENRNWSTKIRGEILIHASKTFDWYGLEEIREIDATVFHDIYCKFDLNVAHPATRSGEFSGIVGKATLIDCVTEYDNPWFFGPNGFRLKDSQPLPFYRFPGKPGFFDVPWPPSMSEPSDLFQVSELSDSIKQKGNQQ